MRAVQRNPLSACETKGSQSTAKSTPFARPQGVLRWHAETPEGGRRGSCEIRDLPALSRYSEGAKRPMHLRPGVKPSTDFNFRSADDGTGRNFHRSPSVILGSTLSWSVGEIASMVAATKIANRQSPTMKRFRNRTQGCSAPRGGIVAFPLEMAQRKMEAEPVVGPHISRARRSLAESMVSSKPVRRAFLSGWVAVIFQPIHRHNGEDRKCGENLRISSGTSSSFRAKTSRARDPTTQPDDGPMKLPPLEQGWKRGVEVQPLAERLAATAAGNWWRGWA